MNALSQFRSMNVPDRVGFAASFACAIHCAVLPVVLPLLMVSGFGWLADTRVEWGLLGTILLIGSVAMIRGFRKHRSSKPGLVFALALGLLLTGRFLAIAEQDAGEVLMVVGGLLTAISHLLNHRRLCTCPHPIHARP